MSPPSVELRLDLPDAGPFHVVGGVITEELSELTRARVEVATDGDLGRVELLGAEAAVRIELDGMTVRRFTLIVGGIRYLGAEGGLLRFAIELFPKLFRLHHSLNTRKFRGLSAEQIVTRVLDAGAVEHAFRLTRATPVKSYCVQYHESDLAFVRRLLEIEGIYFSFTPEGVLVLADRSESEPPVEGAEETVFELIESEGALAHGERGIFEIAREHAVAPGAITVDDFDWKRPSLELRRTASSDVPVDRELEIYEVYAGYRDPEEGEAIAKRRLEAARVPADVLVGIGTVPAFAPARRFAFAAPPHADEAFSGEYLLVRVEHELRRGGWLGGKETSQGTLAYRHSFTAIPRRVPFRPPRVTPAPRIDGHHSAMVRGPKGEEIHTDTRGRFRAQFHWDREALSTDEDSRWLRLCQETASSMHVARVGWEAWVAYVDGDPDRPIGIARHINGAMPPTYPLPGKGTLMAIRTPSSPGGRGFNELRLEDGAGAQAVDMKAQRDLIVRVKRDHGERVGGREVHVCANAWTHTVGRDQEVSVSGSSKLECHGDVRVAVGGARSVSIGGNDTLQAREGQDVVVAGDDAEIVGSVRLTVAGGIQLPNPLAAVKRSLAGLSDAVSSAVNGVAPSGGVAVPEGVAQPTAEAAQASLEQGAMAVGHWAQSIGNASEAFSGALSSIRESGGLTGAIDASLSGAVASVGELLPSPEELLNDATGGLAGASSVSEAINALLVGGIDRSAGEALHRRVGGAFVGVTAMGSASLLGGAAFAETVGGVRLGYAYRGGLLQNVSGPLLLTTGGALVRIARSDVRVASPRSAVKAGLSASLRAVETMDLRSATISVDGADMLEVLGDSGAAIELTPEGMTWHTPLKLEAQEHVAFTAPKEHLT